jgi:outer membrane protein assembly factor BamB
VLGEVVALPTGGTVTAVDTRTGAMVWQAPQLDHLATADGVILGTRGASGPRTSITVTALDAASGQQRWTAPGFPSYGGLLAVGEGVIIVRPADSPGLVAYELSSGNER